jgi:hypothetical protein
MERDTHVSVYYDEITRLPFEDAGLFEDLRLSVAGPRAYPWAARLGPGRRIRRLSARDRRVPPLLQDPRAMERAQAEIRRALESGSPRPPRRLPVP